MSEPTGRAAEQIIGRCFSIPGYIQHVAAGSIYEAPTDYDDLTDTQAARLHVDVRSEKMQGLVVEVFAEDDRLQGEHDLPSARPWLDLAQLLADATG